MTSLGAGYSIGLDTSLFPYSGASQVGPVDVYSVGFDTRSLADYPDLSERLGGGYSSTLEVFFGIALPGGSPPASITSDYIYLKAEASSVEFDYWVSPAGPDDAFSFRIKTVDTRGDPRAIFQAPAASCEELMSGPRFCPLAGASNPPSEAPPLVRFDDLEIAFAKEEGRYSLLRVPDGGKVMDLGISGGRHGRYAISIYDPALLEEDHEIGSIVGRRISVRYECLEER